MIKLITSLRIIEYLANDLVIVAIKNNGDTEFNETMTIEEYENLLKDVREIWKNKPGGCDVK